MIIDVAAVIISLCIGVIFFISSNNIVLSIIFFALYCLAYFLLIRKRIKQYLRRIQTVHSCYQFISSFIVSMSVKPSLDDAFAAASRNQNKYYDDFAANLEENETSDKIVYLRKYFNMAIYKLFINVLNIYQEQGGSIIQIADSLLKESNRIERSLRESVNIGNKKVIEFVLLWVITIGILVFMRFGLSQFYVKMMSNIYFEIMLSLFFLFLIGSIILFFFRYTNIYVKEDNL